MNTKSNGKKPDSKEQSSTSRKIPFLKKKNSSSNNSNPSDVNNLGGALNNMKIGQEKDNKQKEKEKKEEKKASANSKLKPIGKDETSSTVQQSSSKDATKTTPFDKVILKANGVTYCADSVVGNGSFGVVVRATVMESNDVVAIKKVLQDKRYKNRELQIMQQLSHPNIVELKNNFFTNGEKPDEVFLNLVLEFIPDTVYRVARHYSKLKQSVPIVYVKLYTYQLLRSLGYIHALGICHRDIKPQNLLLDPNSNILKLCDFGSAKMLITGEPNVSYICSRYYRAPELVFGATNYSTAIDVWSAGCVLAELLLGQPLFPGESGVDQLVEIIKVLGTPTREEIQAMNQTYTEYKFPQIKGSPWTKVFRSKPPEAVDLVSKLLQYNPSLRVKPYEALAHPFFDELREPNLILPNGKTPPPIFNFSEVEVKAAGGYLSKLIPKHAEHLLQANSHSSSRQ